MRSPCISQRLTPDHDVSPKSFKQNLAAASLPDNSLQNPFCGVNIQVQTEAILGPPAPQARLPSQTTAGLKAKPEETEKGANFEPIFCDISTPFSEPEA